MWGARFYKKYFEILNSKQKKSLLYLILFLLVGTILETVSLGVIIPVLTFITKGEAAAINSNIFPGVILNADNLQIILLSSLILVYIIKGVFLSYFTWYQNKFSFGLTADISNLLFEGYLMRDYQFHLNRKSSDLIRNITTEVGTFTSVLMAGVVVLSELSVVISIIILLFLVNPYGALLSFMILAVSGLGFSRIARKYNSFWGNQRHIHDSLKIKIILQSFDGVKEIKHYCKENIFVQQYIKNNLALITPTQKQYTLQSMPRIIFEVIAVVICLVYVLAMAMANQDINSIIPQIGLLIAAAFRLIPSFSRIISSTQTLRFAEPVINNLTQEISDLKIKNQNIKKSIISVGLTLQKSIAFKGVMFSYNSNSRVFENLNFEIKANEFLAIIGESGAGKSTMIDLMLGLLKPDKGAICVDGEDICKNLNEWRKLVGYVPQSFYLFDDTIKYNITFGETNVIDQEQLSDALRLSQLTSFVQGLPLGINTVIGEKGSQLSGGQKQRLAIARALYLKPKVLILDEPTSALDNTTENELMLSLNELRNKIDVTIILITHSALNLRHCDRVFEIRDKRIQQISENI
jgi:ATP-binding cassette, subfamily B, bacterial PglK